MDVHLKIVLDVIKDTGSMSERQAGKLAVGVICRKESFSLAVPLQCAIWRSHDLRTWWHSEEGAYL